MVNKDVCKFTVSILHACAAPSYHARKDGRYSLTSAIAFAHKPKYSENILCNSFSKNDIDIAEFLES